MSKLTAILASALLLASAGSALAEPPPAALGTAPEPLWFEAPAVAVRPAPARRAAQRTKKVKLAARKNRYGNISLESLAARERGKPVVECAVSCGPRQMKRKPKAPRPEKRVSDVTQAAHLYR